MGEQIVAYAGDRILCCTSQGHSIARPQIEGDHGCVKDERIKALEDLVFGLWQHVDTELPDELQEQVRVVLDAYCTRVKEEPDPSSLMGAVSRKGEEENR